MKQGFLKNLWSFRSPWLWATGVILILVIGVLLREDRPVKNLQEYRVTPVLAGFNLLERGVLTSKVKVPIIVKGRGQILEINRNGTYVHAGDPVVRMDEIEPREAIRAGMHDLTRSKCDKIIQESKYRQMDFEEHRKLEVDKARLEHAVLEERVETQGLTPADKRLLEIEIELAALDLEDAKDNLERQRRLFEKEFITRSTLEPYERSVVSASAFLHELKVKAELKAKALPEERRVELRENVEKARATVERGEKAVARKLEEIQNAIDHAKAEIASTTFSLQFNQSLLDNTLVHAATSGVFVIRMFRDFRSGGGWTEKRPGVDVWGNDVVADIIDPSSMQIEITINEADFNRIKRGMPVRIRIPALPNQEFQGNLVELGGVGRDRFDLAAMGQESSKTGVTVFNGIVDFKGNGQEFRPGMSAEVEIIVEEPGPRLLIPREGILDDGVHQKVYRKSGTSGVPVVIKGRIFNETLFLVEEGLKEGDVIYLNYSEARST